MSDYKIILPTNKRFGLFFSLVFFLFFFFFFVRGNSNISLLFASFSILFFILSFIYPKILQPLNKLWFQIGMLLNKVISPIILGLIFFGIMTPLALFMKIAGRDELRLKKARVDSYWRQSTLKDSDKGSFENQF